MVCTGHESFEGNLFSSYAPLVYCTGLKIACYCVWFSFIRHGLCSGFMPYCTYTSERFGVVYCNSWPTELHKISYYFIDQHVNGYAGERTGLFCHYWTLNIIMDIINIKYFFYYSYQEGIYVHQSIYSITITNTECAQKQLVDLL